MTSQPNPASCALLFDIDGTLVDSTYHHAVAWHRAFRRCDLEIEMFRIHRSIGMGGDRLVPHLADEDVETRHGSWLRSAWREEYVALKAEVEPLPGAAEVVTRAARDGYRVALASSGDPEFADEAIELLGIRSAISTWTSSEDVDGSKPEPDLVEETLSRLEGVTRAVLVGDTPYDVESARRAGIGCIGLLTGGYGRAELTEAGAVLVVDVPTDLLAIDWLAYCSPIVGQDPVHAAR